MYFLERVVWYFAVYYLPQRSWGKVMSSQACVILFKGGVSASVHAGIPPPEQTPPGADSPGADTPPGADIPPTQSMMGDTVNARAVRILLECNLVPFKILFLSISLSLVEFICA